MEIGIQDLRSRAADVVGAVKAGERVVLTADGAPIADVVPRGRRTCWLGGANLCEQLSHRAADAALRKELGQLAGQRLGS